MCFGTLKHRLLRLALVSVALFGLSLPAAQAQGRFFCWPRQDSCPTCPAPTTAPEPKEPKAAVAPETPPTPGPVTTAALGDTMASFGPGYLDNPVPFSHFRLRFDSAYDGNRPDRAEFFYAKCGCFGGNAKGPPLAETSVDYQDLTGYLEYAPREWFSAFVEVPWRFLNPDINANTHGVGDMNTGFKVALFRNEKSILTFQGRVYILTGDSERGLGTNHVSLEPSLLYAANLTDRLVLFGQFGDWIPIGGTDFAGNILRYGAGLSYTALATGRFNVAPVVEVLGWTVLNGQELAFPENQTFNARGDTIVNGKFGVRFGFGDCRNSRLLNNSDIYIGYGRALTGEVWYKDILRVEYRLRF